MEKISGILPSNARLSTVDLASSSPIRRGQPGFGREEAKLATRLSGKEKTVLENVAPTYENFTQSKLKARREAEIARKTTEGFFVNQGQSIQAQRELLNDQENINELAMNDINTASLAYEFEQAKNALSNTEPNTTNTLSAETESDTLDVSPIQEAVVEQFEETIANNANQISSGSNGDGTQQVGRNLSVVA